MTRFSALLAVLMAALLVLDQLSKFWVRANIALYETTALLPQLLDLTHVENRGVSFSFLGSIDDFWRAPLLIGVSVAAMILLGFYWKAHGHEMNRLHHLAFGLILPGAAGNLIDRALFGTVTDFFHFRFFDQSFFVNNLADIFISMGVVFFLGGMLLAARRAG